MEDGVEMRRGDRIVNGMVSFPRTLFHGNANTSAVPGVAILTVTALVASLKGKPP